MGLKTAPGVLAFAACMLLAMQALAGGTAATVLKDGSGKEVGKAELTDTPNGILIKLTLDGVPAGEHAFHVHETGKCEPPDFKSAGGHYNPDKTKHGLLNPQGPHAGDMPNIHVPADGKLTVEVLNGLVTIDGERALLDDDGSALVLHGMPDDYKSDPAGHAGDRIACGVLAK
jgi:Cu-Zn family superoxide dismutase